MERSNRASENVAHGRSNERRPVALRSAQEFERRHETPETLRCSLRSGHRPDRALCQTKDKGPSMNRSGLRSIPSVDKIVLALGETGFPRLVILAVVRRELETIRGQKTTPDFD